MSQLVAVWDRELRGRPLTLALSGSEVALMERLQQGGQPLYGRPSWSARIRAFDYRDAARMVPGRTAREAALTYGVFGGTPRYLASSAEDRTLAGSVIRAMLSPRGDVHLQVQNIIEQEKGIREPAEYRAVLAAIADGKTEINEIGLAAGLGQRSHVVRRALAVREAYARYHRRWGLAGADVWSRWEGRDRNRRDIELDIVARLDDGRMLSGEIKWSSRPVGYELHLALQRNLEDLGRFGPGLGARGALRRPLGRPALRLGGRLQRRLPGPGAGGRDDSIGRSERSLR